MRDTILEKGLVGKARLPIFDFLRRVTSKPMKDHAWPLESVREH
jgi:hypothetical protein